MILDLVCCFVDWFTGSVVALIGMVVSLVGWVAGGRLTVGPPDNCFGFLCRLCCWGCFVIFVFCIFGCCSWVCGACGDFIGFASCGGAADEGIGLSADTAGRAAAAPNNTQYTSQYRI